MITEIYGRIDERMKALDLNPTSAARQAGLSLDAVRNIKRAIKDGKEVSITTRVLEALAPVLGVTPAWLLSGEPSNMVPLISMVSAGNLRDVEGVSPREVERWVVAGDLPANGSWVALAVEGDSMNEIAPDGSVILVDRRDDRLIEGRFYVFSVDGGAATFKRWFSNPPRLQPYSKNRDLPSIPVTGDDLYVFGRVRRILVDV